MGDIMHKAKLMSRGSTETELDVATMFVLLDSPHVVLQHHLFTAPP